MDIKDGWISFFSLPSKNVGKGRNWKFEIQRKSIITGYYVRRTAMMNEMLFYIQIFCWANSFRKSFSNSSATNISFVNASLVLISLIKEHSHPLSLSDIFPLTFYCPSQNLHLNEKDFAYHRVRCSAGVAVDNISIYLPLESWISPSLHLQTDTEHTKI